MKVNIITVPSTEKVVLVGLTNHHYPIEIAKEHLDELEFLAKTSGARTSKTFLQKLDRPDRRTFVGKGKLAEIQVYVQEEGIDAVIFDDDLSSSQVRNLEKVLECKILDRSLLILNIFSLRAKTAQSQTQVELAQYEYLLPRLTNMWTHLSKQKGGIGMRGPGEKELETDRRIVRDKISLLKKKLVKIDHQSLTRRKARERMVRVALVGYTNVGKSTLMNLLSKTEAFAENKLFATVDSLVRKVVIDQIPFLLTDTVGFIRKLPHTLIESFKSTLDEIREADLILHVVDISHPYFEEQMEIVQTTLREIGIQNTPQILIFNKIDRINTEDTKEHDPTLLDLDQLEKSYRKNEQQDCVFVSATDKSNIKELKQTILDKVKQKHFAIYPNYFKNGIY